ncbi:MAG: DUF4340 domain-containing protein [Lachnospiraceae bacterium]|nr:DUF4340 domain-containing protein [Lachnospiraceae bacterium]
MEKKQIRNLIILVIILAACIGVFLAVKGKGDAESSEGGTKESTASIPIGSLSADDIVKLSWMVDGEEYSAEKRDDVWYSGSVSLNGQDYSVYTANLENLAASRVLEGDEVKPREFGLDTPSNIIKVQTVDGTGLEITVGIQNPVTQEYYIWLNDDKDRVYLIPSTVPLDFSHKPEKA